jgi:16S rRNA (cytosine1402-N4)-methyltransferase
VSLPDRIVVPGPREEKLVEREGDERGFHDPVMVKEVLASMEGVQAGTVLDGTLGAGGHAEAILRRWPRCRLLGVDRDGDALRIARRRLQGFEGRVRFLRMTFDEAAADATVRQDGLDGALLDLGLSSIQLEADHRGFAFRRGVPLDMRMDPEGDRMAADVLNQAEESELARVFRDYGEEPRAKALARHVIVRRRQTTFRTADDLVACLTRVMDRTPTSRDKARVFQSLRIAVNRELEILARALPSIRDRLNPARVLVVLSYNSLEDRIVKEAFREWSRDCVCPPKMPICRCRGVALGEPVNRRPIRPEKAEVARNPRARSARLRAWRKAA